MTSERWRELTEAAVEAAGFDLEEFSVVNAGRRRLVRVIIDSDDGVSLDAAAALSRELSAVYDAAEQSGDLDTGTVPYTLEVTSPGIGRPMTELRHFRRATGRLVAFTTADGPLTGYVLGIDPVGAGSVDIVPVGAKPSPKTLTLPEIVKAKMEADFAGPSAAITALLDADPRSAAVRRRAAELAAGHDADDADDTDDVEHDEENDDEER